MPIVQVQKQIGTTGASPRSVTLSPAATAGNWIILVTGGTATGTATCPGFTFAAEDPSSTSTRWLTILYAKAAGGETTLTVTYPGGTSMEVAAFEYSGLDPTNPLDQIASDGQNSGTTVTTRSTGTTPLTTVAEELVLACVSTGSTVTGLSWSGGFAVEEDGTSTHVGSLLVNATGTYTSTATWTTLRVAGGAIVTFKAPSDSIQPTRPALTPRRIGPGGPFILERRPADDPVTTVQINDSDSFTFNDSFGEQISAAVADTLESFTFIDSFGEQINANLADALELLAFGELPENIAAVLADTIEVFTFLDGFEPLIGVGDQDFYGYLDGFEPGIGVASSDTFTFIDSFTEAISATLADQDFFTFTELQEAIAATLSDTLESFAFSELNATIAANLADALELLAFGELPENLAATLAGALDAFTFTELPESIAATLADTLEQFTWLELGEQVDVGLVQISDSDSFTFSDGFAESIAATLADALEVFGLAELQEAIAATVGGGLDGFGFSDDGSNIALASSDAFTLSELQEAISANLADSDSFVFIDLEAIAATLTDSDAFAWLELLERIDIPLPPGVNGTATMVCVSLADAQLILTALADVLATRMSLGSVEEVCVDGTATLTRTPLATATIVVT